MLAIDEHVQTMNIEERRVATKPIEVLEDVPLDKSNPEVYQDWNKYGREDEARSCPFLKKKH